MNKLFDVIKPFGRLIKAFTGFCYDFSRFVSYSAWQSNMHDDEIRNYHAVKVYHSLEKSMSFKNRKPDSGWSNAYALLDVLKYASTSKCIGYHDKAAYDVLKKFIEFPGNSGTERAREIERELEKMNFCSNDEHGVKTVPRDDFLKGALISPEEFFFSRHSLRDFKDEIVDEKIIQRAVLLARKTPSVCNRQPWHIYHTTDDSVKAKALRYQTGNRGFGENIPNLLIVTADLKAFMPSQEHYQHWIDGGMYAMSLVYALHSLGVASCCLNWSQSPANDKRIRKLVDIKSNHSIIMMIAAGWPDDENTVCISGRRPVDEIYTCL